MTPARLNDINQRSLAIKERGYIYGICVYITAKRDIRPVYPVGKTSDFVKPQKCQVLLRNWLSVKDIRIMYLFRSVPDSKRQLLSSVLAHVGKSSKTVANWNNYRPWIGLF